jgi:polyferredoxin
MESPEQSPGPKELSRRARRAVRIIYLGMAIFILLPFFLVWLTGSIGF